MDWNAFFTFLMVIGVLIGIFCALSLFVVAIFWPNWRLHRSDKNNSCSYLGEWLNDTIPIKRESFLWNIICKPIPWYGVILIVISMIFLEGLLIAVTEESVGRFWFFISKAVAVYLFTALFGLVCGYPNGGGAGGDGFI